MSQELFDQLRTAVREMIVTAINEEWECNNGSDDDVQSATAAHIAARTAYSATLIEIANALGAEFVGLEDEQMA